jgi:hypothetical protein
VLNCGLSARSAAGDTFLLPLPVGRHLEHGALAANIQRFAFICQQTIYCDNKHADIGWPRAPRACLGTISTARDNIDCTARSNGNNMITLQLSADVINPPCSGR